MDPLKYTELLCTVQACQQVLTRVSEQLERHGQEQDTQHKQDYKQKYETLLGERVHLLNELGQLLLEREKNKRPMYFSPTIDQHKKHKKVYQN